MTPTRWRKRPVVIDAVEVTADNGADIIRWITGDGGVATLAANGAVTIHTPEGRMRAVVGDYVIREPFPTDHRRFYPSKRAIFERGFDRVILESREEVTTS